MSSFYTSIQPYTTMQGCGDFAIVTTSKGGELIVVGDIGGHGNWGMDEIVATIKQSITKNLDAGIHDIFNIITEIDVIRRIGLTLFIGRFEPKLCVLHYIGVGNLQLMQIKNNHVKRLRCQDGVIGLSIPTNINHQVIKFKSNELLVVATDGIKTLSPKRLELFDWNRPIEDIANNLTQQYASKDDDSLSMVFKPTCKNVESNIIAQTSSLTAIDTVPAPRPVYQNILSAPDTESITSSNFENFEKIKYSQRKIIDIEKHPYISRMKDDLLFASLISSPMIRLKVNNLINFLGFTGLIKVKIIQFIMELIYYEVDCFDVYIDSDFLQLRANIDLSVLKRLQHLFSSHNIAYEYRSQKFFLHIPLPTKIDIISNGFVEFKEMLNLGIDKEHYQSFKQDQKRELILSNQSKLAAMGEMIGAIAHQWRQPLNELAIRIQKIRIAYDYDKIDATYVKKFINDNLATINFMSQTVDDFRNFFRVDKSKASFDIKKSIESVINLQESQLKNNNITVTIKGETFQFFGLKSEFEQVILNLMSNSRDALKESKVTSAFIDIQIDRENQKIMIFDNGKGIPEHVLTRVFEPYYTTKEQGQGTGLGLYLAKMIIEKNMSGELTISNKDGPHGYGAMTTIDLIIK